MLRLEDLKNGNIVTGLLPGQSATVITTEWIGEQGVNLVYRTPAGDTTETTLWREDEQRLTLLHPGRRWTFDADGTLLRLVTEATRIRLAHFFDPWLAVHASLIDPLPHQISAVYGEMLPRQPLRFLLADDPGAGKTIMAGLLIKELIARSALERCLVVAPGSLVEQWQDELGEKFGLEFRIFSRDMQENTRTGNPFNDHPRLIARLDVLSRNPDLQEKLAAAADWDLVIADEAHRMSATLNGTEAAYTKRYRLGQKLGDKCHHFLLMSATPHNGKEADFQLFMALLDPDRFVGHLREDTPAADTSDMMRRLTKEELLRFDGRPLFPERRAYTVKYQLSHAEADIYTAVTEYVRNEMNRMERFTDHDDKKRNNIGFALQILQRRLASSPAAIYNSLKRRRERLETRLAQARLAPDHSRIPDQTLPKHDQDELEDFSQAEIDQYEDQISAALTAAETTAQLDIEIRTLANLEHMAFDILRSGHDTKWQQLNRILDDNLMRDPQGHRRKLIIFTEPRDTLEYLHNKIAARLGKPRAVDIIHGGITRAARRNIVERFMQDPDLLILVANDAAGEGVNLQRGHLMVNYDLPWNPNRIEQRFGRIHRIGQTQVCHPWNLVADDTREGQVYARLLEKLETARQALGGRVYDVLGQLFQNRPLHRLLLDAIQYNNDEQRQTGLFDVIDNAVNHDHLRGLLRQHRLTNDTMPQDQIRRLRLQMEQAEAQRLQPHHTQSFFLQAFRHIRGQIKQREDNRWEILHVPGPVRDHARQVLADPPIQKKYQRICFEKTEIGRHPTATLISPGHPLLQAVIDLTCQQNSHLMQQGATLIDDTDDNTRPTALFLLRHAIQDACAIPADQPNVISEKLQFAAMDSQGQTTDAGIAPHLDIRPATPEEMAAIQDIHRQPWLDTDLESQILQFAETKLAQDHLDEVRARRLPQIDHIERQVRTRLQKEINYWDSRAAELREQQSDRPHNSKGNLQLNMQNAENRAGELQSRLQKRLHTLRQERQITPRPPEIIGGLLVIPKGLLRQRIPQPDQIAEPAAPYSPDPLARRQIELKAMQAVMHAERRLGNTPQDVSA